MGFLLRQGLSVTAESDLQSIHFKTRDMRVKINDKIYRLKEIESGVDGLMELVEEPKYKDGDFLHSDWDDENITIIYREINGNDLYFHVSKSNTIGLGFGEYKFWPNDGDFRLATESEKKELTDALEPLTDALKDAGTTVSTTTASLQKTKAIVDSIDTTDSKATMDVSEDKEAGK